MNAKYVQYGGDVEYISPYAPPVVILYCVYVGHDTLGLSAHIVVEWKLKLLWHKFFYLLAIDVQ